MATSEAVAENGHSQHRRFVFGECEVDLERGSLKRRGDDVPLRPKSFAMLQYLLEHAGQLVGREQLLAAVWPGVFVTDDSIAQCLIEIRKALGDDEREMVRTVPRRGLIFDVPVRLEAAAASPVPRRSPRPARHVWVLAISLAGVTALLLWWSDPWERATAPEQATASTPMAKSIAVLRFTDMSEVGDQSYLADGLSEEIMHTLAQSPSLRVIARASSFAVEGQPIPAIASELDVTYILEGSVRRQGDEMRVTAQLIDASTSSHIWSRSYDRVIDDILDVQRDIADAVAATLEVSLADGDATIGIDTHAYELFLEGRYFYLRRADQDLAMAQQRFEEAVSISPRFARAWTGLSAVANVRLHSDPISDLSPPERAQLLETQRHATEQALRFGPNLPEAHIRASYFYFFSGDRDRARRHAEIARSIDPDHWLVRTALSNQLQNSGRIEDSIELVRREVQRDPLNFVLRENVVGLLIWAGRFEGAQAELDRISEMMPSLMEDSRSLKRNAARVQILTGDFDAAAISAKFLSDNIERAQLLALAYHGLGRQGESKAALEELTSSPNTAWRDLYVAEVHAFRGESSEALEWLREIEFEPDCTEGLLTRSVYYSPFLVNLSGNRAWEEYRAGVLDSMRECLLGLQIDPV